MNSLISALVPLIVAIFGSSGFWAYMQSKKDKTKDVLEAITDIKKDVHEVKNDMLKLKADIEENEAKNCRNRIVRFADEIRLGQKKSKDFYDHIINDITTYKNFCDEHTNFMNGIAEVSIKKIMQHYENDDFL